ncbi:MAG: D-xylose transport system permease protein [Chloroflexota bacterium]|nr:D-xylose transport system permease protein [Chloroflexota bacterium]
MTDAAGTAPDQVAGRSRPSVGDLLRATEIDLRLFGMVAALIAIWVGLGLANSAILQPVNFLTFSVQAASTAVLATGMVLVIVSRNIDLSVGSVVGVIGMAYAVLMADIFPTTIGVNHPLGWIIALALGLGLGVLIGGFQGFLIAYVGIPSFVVTLGGLLGFRGVIWVLSGGTTVAPDDATFVLLGGGPEGSLGGPLSWVLGAVICVATILLLVTARRQRRKFGFALRPVWAETLLGVLACAFVLGAVYVANSYHWPPGLATQYATAHGITEPPGGLQIEAGIPFPLLIVIGVSVFMSFLATRRRFGRDIFAYGGNPDAAELAGINTRWTIMKTFILMGVLGAISAAIASARLNGGTLDLGTGYELYVIAAAVIGGTSFAGGIGTIPGAILGALVMQSLQYGLGFLGFNSPIVNIVAAVVLVTVVGIDSWNRRRGS